MLLTELIEKYKQLGLAAAINTFLVNGGSALLASRLYEQVLAPIQHEQKPVRLVSDNHEWCVIRPDKFRGSVAAGFGARPAAATKEWLEAVGASAGILESMFGLVLESVIDLGVKAGIRPKDDALVLSLAEAMGIEAEVTE